MLSIGLKPLVALKPSGTSQVEHLQRIGKKFLPANHGHKLVDERMCSTGSKPLVPYDVVEGRGGQSYNREAQSDGERPHEGLLHHEREEVRVVVGSHFLEWWITRMKFYMNLYLNTDFNRKKK